MAKRKVSVNEEELPSNSKSIQVAPIRVDDRGDTEDIQPVKRTVRKAIRGNAVIRKKTLTQSIASSFLSEEIAGVGSYVMHSVLIPAFKELINEMVSSGLQMVLFGEAKPKSKDRGDRTKVSYGSYYKDKDRDDREPRRRVTRGKFDLSDIYFRHHEEAEEVLEQLCDMLDDYDVVTVADYFDLAGIDGATWIHSKYGWDDLSSARNTHTRYGWAIILPDPEPLD